MNQDQEHLRLLRIFHIVIGIFYLLISFVPTIHITIGFMMALSPDSMSNGSGEPPPAFMGWMFVAIGFFVMFMIAAIGVLNLLAARGLNTYTRRTLCLVVAALNLLNTPLGTILGVFTIVVLQRPGVIQLFKQNEV